MYCVRFTVVFLLCLPAIGCQTIPEAIPQAEAIVMEHPDSAVRLLRGFPAGGDDGEPEEGQESQYACE